MRHRRSRGTADAPGRDMPLAECTATTTNSGSTRRTPRSRSSARTAGSTPRSTAAAPGITSSRCRSRSSMTSSWTMSSRFTTCAADCRTTAPGADQIARGTRLARLTPTGIAPPAATDFTPCLTRTTRTTYTPNRRTAAFRATTRAPARAATSGLRSSPATSRSASIGTHRSCRRSTW